MKRLIGFKTAGSVLTGLLILLAVFHVLVLTRLIPADIVWAGQLEGLDSSVTTMETISLVVTLLFALTVSVRVGLIGNNFFPRTARVVVWVICAFFVLNTVGNIHSHVPAENLIFAPLTAVMAILALRVALEKTTPT